MRISCEAEIERGHFRCSSHLLLQYWARADLQRLHYSVTTVTLFRYNGYIVPLQRLYCSVTTVILLLPVYVLMLTYFKYPTDKHDCCSICSGNELPSLFISYLVEISNLEMMMC